MRVQLTLALAAIVLKVGAAAAGPCAADLYKANEEIGRRLDAIAAKGHSADESAFATTHQQPTPATIAGAEEKVGDISEADVKTVRAYLAEAKKADDAGDKPACETALAEARRILKM